MSKDKTLTFKTYHVNPLGTWLQGLELPGKQSRARNRFITDFIGDKSKEIEEQRQTMLKKYAEKDDKGEPKMKKLPEGDQQVYDINPANLAKYNDEFVEYMGEDYIIDVTKAKEADIKVIADLVLNTEEKFVDKQGNLAATMYNEWCNVFETLNK